ncbi:serine protease family S33 [Thraustotheca clavata]|uniref:Serine protease family S33 n=1 Tax=Thraustotheca clavata TaxID=74557 RepID=A0A1V9ZH80_9STRA|nr:serine protease family S33 [Thraustotheca clavata]
MLYLLIVTSELWRFPSESLETLKTTSSNALISSGISDLLPLVCIASGAKDPSCASLLKPSNDYLLQYSRDQFYDKPITIPDQSSVLVLSGLLDPQTVPKYARYQFDSFVGTAKRLVEFEYSAHGTVLNSPPVDYDSTCAVMLIASYIQQDGNVNAIESSCALVSGTPYETNIMVDVTMFGIELDSTNTYEGAPLGQFEAPSILASIDYSYTFIQARNYRIAMIVGYVLVGVLLFTVITMCISRNRQKKNAEEAPVLTPSAEV